MQMTTEARAWLDATVRSILARHPLGDPERAGITYELMSHLHAAGEARAAAAGRSEVAREDLDAAVAEAGGKRASRRRSSSHSRSPWRECCSGAESAPLQSTCSSSASGLGSCTADLSCSSRPSGRPVGSRGRPPRYFSLGGSCPGGSTILR